VKNVREPPKIPLVVSLRAETLLEGELPLFIVAGTPGEFERVLAQLTPELKQELVVWSNSTDACLIDPETAAAMAIALRDKVLSEVGDSVQRVLIRNV